MVTSPIGFWGHRAQALGLLKSQLKLMNTMSSRICMSLDVLILQICCSVLPSPGRLPAGGKHPSWTTGEKPADHLATKKEDHHFQDGVRIVRVSVCVCLLAGDERSWIRGWHGVLHLCLYCLETVWLFSKLHHLSDNGMINTLLGADSREDDKDTKGLHV